MKVMAPTTAPDHTVEQPRARDGRWARDHREPEVSVDTETESEAFDRGVADAQGARPANPGVHIDEYMAGYESWLFDNEDSWES